MKLRLRGSSLRLRLGRSEVAELAVAEQVEEIIQLGPNPGEFLVYRLQLSATHAEPAVEFMEHTITVQLPMATGQSWAAGPEIGIYRQLPWGLRLLVEKDFKCLEARPLEDDHDAFEHPTGTAGAGCGVTAAKAP